MLNYSEVERRINGDESLSASTTPAPRARSNRFCRVIIFDCVDENESTWAKVQF